MRWFRLKSCENFLLHKEHLNGFSFECALTCSFTIKHISRTQMCWFRLKSSFECTQMCSVKLKSLDKKLNGFYLSLLWCADSHWKVRKTSCYIRSIWVGFHLSVPWRADSEWKVRTNFLSHNEQLNGFSSECTLTCSFRSKSSDNFLSHKEQFNGFSS